MALEIERKYLVLNDDWRSGIVKSAFIKQGYFAANPACSIRIRITADSAYLNIKSATLGITRQEFEYPVPPDDAEVMLSTLCIKPHLKKTRHYVDYENNHWEIDEFSGENEGLVVAEIELDDPDQTFSRPSWLGEEVSDDPRYYNVCLVEQPFKNWK